MTERFTKEWIAQRREAAKTAGMVLMSDYQRCIDHIEQQAKRIEELEIHNKNLHLACVNALDLHRESDVPKLKDIPKIIEELRTRVQELEQERRWISVEQSPEEYGYYIIAWQSVVGNGELYSDFGYFKKIEGWGRVNVKYWQPLPQPPKEEE